ncbi:HAUS augmin-like complex subunit 5 isoform 2-T2 [Odontesthes bonariensis]|uniref:HAUS augmin-like complex subunit 5 isoform X2 n=1 Tax=Odontesthes bonariensis TaxID=219752 RepID=UPI003F585F1A
MYPQSRADMADKNLVKELKRWATEEFGLPLDSLPNDNYFKTLCVGTRKSIWKYIIQHVFQHRNVRIMRGNLQWYKVLQDKEAKQAEGQSEAAKRRELQKKMEQLRAEISHLDSQISGTEEQLATQERSISHVWAQVEDNRRRELLLRAFRQHCSLGRKVLSGDTSKIGGHCQVMDQMARKAEVEVLFDDEPSSCKDDDNLNSKAAAEAQVLRELRELCADRIHFYQALQESELKVQHSAAEHMTSKQRTAVFHYWLSTAEKVLGDYPPNHVLSALQYLASGEQKELEEKLAALDLTQDVTALRFRYESNHLLDISAEEDDELLPVKTLLEDAWKEVQQSFVELTRTRSRVQQLKKQLQARKEEAEHEVSGCADEFHNDTMALSALEVELECVMQAAARDYIRDRCIQLDQHNRSRQEALRSLRSQWQSVLDFRKLVVLRQEHIRGLIKGNSTAKTHLIHLHKELQEFIEDELVSQFEDVVTAANSLRNSVSKEAKQFGTVSLLSLDRRTIDGMQRVPASWLSIHRLQSPSFGSLCQSLAFPLYKAPEELCSQSRSQQLELRFLRQLLHLYSATLQRVQKEAERLHASDQKALLSRVMEEDQNLLKSLLPRARSLTHRCAQGLSYGDQVKTAISYWWDKPAQHVLPQLGKGGLTFQQWLQRWKLAAKAS